MIMQIQPLTLLLCLWLVFEINTCARLDFHSYIQDVNWFQEGIKLELYCQQVTTNDINIESSTQGIIVEGSHLVKGVADEYEFQKNLSVSVLFVKALSRNEDGVFICSEAGQDKKFASVHVFYSPSGKSPQCMSNYESPVIYDDLRQDYINFSCITDEGNPPVSITIGVFQSESIYNVSDVTKLCNKYQNVDDKDLSFNCHMNQSLNNATFNCNVTQQFPYPYNGGYSRSCSFGPLHFLSNFSITIDEEIVTVEEGENFNLTCSKNITMVEIKWFGIPEGWDYHETKDDYLSHLWITHVKQHSMSEITVQCIGYYGNRNVTDSVKINIINVQSGRIILFIAILVIVVAFGIITFLTAGIFIVCFHWRGSRSNVHKRVDQTTYTTTVMAPNDKMEENIDRLQGLQEYDCPIVTFHSPGENSKTKYYETPLQSSRDDVDNSGYLVPTSAHPQPPTVPIC